MILPQAKDLSKAVNKCSSAVSQFTPNLCKLVKTTLKSNRDDYVRAGNSLTDIEYLFQDVQTFYGSFLNCLNEQNETVNAATSIRNIENLIYQLDIYILTGIDSKLAESADSLGVVFGESVKTVITTISSQFSEEFNIIKTSLETLKEDFQVIVDSGSEITTSSVSSDLNITALTTMITAFKDASVSSLQMSTVISGFIAITTTLDTITTSISTVESISQEMVTKSSYDLDITIQASRKLLTTSMLLYQNDVSDSFGEFFKVSSSLFTADVDIQASRVKVDAFVISLNDNFESISDKFVTTFTDYLTTMSMQVQTLKDTVSTSTQQVTDFLAESIASNSGSFIKCLGPSTNNAVAALELIHGLGQNSSECISAQTNVSLNAQSLMSFVTEDVVLNARGIADKLCGCSVKGGKKDREISKKCINKVSETTSLLNTIIFNIMSR